MLTPEEAKKKWCPYALEWDANGGAVYSFNRRHGGGPGSDSLCLASDCMAWRHAPSELVTDGDGNVIATIHRGFCGPAGPM